MVFILLRRGFTELLSPETLMASRFAPRMLMFRVHQCSLREIRKWSCFFGIVGERMVSALSAGVVDSIPKVLVAREREAISR